MGSNIAVPYAPDDGGGDMDDREGSAIDDDENLNMTGEYLLSELEETRLKLNYESGLASLP